MRTRTPFFRFVWRVNAILILICLSLVLMYLAGFVSTIALSILTPNAPRNTVTTSPEPAQGERLALSLFEEVRGTPYLVAPLVSLRNNPSPLSYSKESSVTRNYLFLDKSVLSQTWLLPTNDRIVLDRRPICAGSDSTDLSLECSEVRWFAVVSVAEDSNGDKQLSESDTKALGFCSASGAGYRDLLSGFDEVLSISSIPIGSARETRIVAVTRRGQEVRVAQIDPQAGTVVAEAPIAVAGVR